MSALVLTFPHLPPALQSVTVALFPSIEPSTSSSLRARLIAAAGPNGTPAERSALNFAFLDASLLVSARHLRTGVHQALLGVARGGGAMKTRTAHSEVLFALHPGNNIGESIRKFGISESTTALLLLRVGSSGSDFSSSSPDAVLAEMRALVQGESGGVEPIVADLAPSTSSSTDPTRGAASANSGGDGNGPASSSQPRSQTQSEADAALDAHLAKLTNWDAVEAVYKLGKEADLLFGRGQQSVSAGPGSSSEGAGARVGGVETTARRRAWVERVVTSTVAMKPVAA